MKAAVLKDIIQNIVDRGGLSLSEVADFAKVNRSHLSTILNNDLEKEVGAKVEYKLRRAYPSYFPETNKSNEVALPADPPLQGSAKSLDTLVESNRALAESIKIQAEANKSNSDAEKISAENTRELIRRIVAPTADGEAGNTLSDPAILVPLVEILADIASGKVKYRSKREAVAELGMKLSLHKAGKANLKDTLSGGGKIRTGQ